MVYIIVEGITDKALVENILSDKTEKTDFKFLGLKGDGSVIKTIKELSEKDTSENQYFAIIDADKSFKDRNTHMQILIKDKNIDYFIFPNHKDNGDLETLLLSNIDKNNRYIKCFDNYRRCVDREIDNKAKLYAYTTLEHDKKPEQYIQELTLGSDFDDLRQKLNTLFEGTEQ